mmetsp:Transcript_14946/g.35612  ORF Transcript_14946/g.35612 Transcript_14946/m.35612 type:complete len:90 (+) Transcript_14946:127-396(+)
MNLFLSVCVLVLCLAATASGFQEESALMELKSQQQGKGLSDWSMTRQKCQWSGVKCNEAGRVIELYLGSTGLGGTLPPQWSVLSDLKIL